MKRFIYILIFLFFGFVLTAQIPINTPFDVRTANPIDGRYVIASLADTVNLNTKLPYDGLITYVLDIGENWQRVNGAWRQLVTNADGSETKVNAGVNVTISGSGTNSDPYVVNSTGGGGTQDISNVLTQGNDAGGESLSNLGGLSLNSMLTMSAQDLVIGRSEVDNIISTGNNRNIRIGYGNILGVGLDGRVPFSGSEATIIGQATGVGSNCIGCIIVGIQTGLGSDIGSSTVLGYANGRVFGGGTSTILGFKSGNQAHGNKNFFAGFSAGASMVGNNIINIQAAGASTKGGIQFSFPASAIDTIDKKIYVPEHGITDSVFTAFWSTTGNYPSQLSSSWDNGFIKFQVVSPDTIQLWGWDRNGHYRGTIGWLPDQGSGTHTLSSSPRYDNTVFIGGGNSGEKGPNRIILGHNDVRKIRVGSDWFNLPGTNVNSQTDNAYWRKTFAYNPFQDAFEVSDTIKASHIVAEQQGNNDLALNVRSTANNSNSRIQISAKSASGTYTNYSIRSTLTEALNFDAPLGINPLGRYLFDRAIRIIPESGFDGSIPLFNLENGAGAGNTTLRISRPNTSGGAMPEIVLNSGSDNARIRYRAFNGVLFSDERDNEGKFSFVTRTATVDSEKMTLTNNGALLINITTQSNTEKLNVNGTAVISGSGGQATTLTGRDANEEITDVNIGSGLSLDSGTLSNTATNADQISIADVGNIYASTDVEGALQEAGFESFLAPANASNLDISRRDNFILIDNLQGATQTQTLDTANTPEGTRVFIKSNAVNEVTFSTTASGFIQIGSSASQSTVSITGTGEMELLFSINTWYQVN